MPRYFCICLAYQYSKDTILEPVNLWDPSGRKAFATGAGADGLLVSLGQMHS